MTHTEPHPQPQQATATQTLEAPRVSGSSKACATGAGMVGAVCCGGGLIALVATGVGAVGAVGFMQTWVEMQGVTLITSGLVVLAVLALAAFVSRRARVGLSPAAARSVFGRTLFRLAAWALGGYFLYWIVAKSILALVGFEYPG